MQAGNSTKLNCFDACAYTLITSKYCFFGGNDIIPSDKKKNKQRTVEKEGGEVQKTKRSQVIPSTLGVLSSCLPAQ